MPPIGVAAQAEEPQSGAISRALQQAFSEGVRARDLPRRPQVSSQPAFDNLGFHGIDTLGDGLEKLRPFGTARRVRPLRASALWLGYMLG